MLRPCFEESETNITDDILVYFYYICVITLMMINTLEGSFR